ncbi:MAG: T9SS type A sorting domain-containing protein [Ignavibacteriaceae bacterium]
MKVIFNFLFIFLFISISLAQTILNVEKIKIYPGTVTQTEPIAAVSPVDPSFIYASAVTININNFFKSEGIYTSTNGGLIWAGNDTCTGSYYLNHGGDPGVAITSTGRLILTHIGSLFPGVYSHYSDDSGKTWSDAYTIFSDQVEDKGSLTIDNNPGSPYKGNLYSVWVELAYPYGIQTSYSTDSGVSWNSPDTINHGAPNRCSGGSVTTDRNGSVYVTWAGVTTDFPAHEDFASFASSKNGGTTWNYNQNIFDMNGINGTLSSKGNIRVNGLPQIEVDNSDGERNSWIYIVTTEINLTPAGSDPDIILHRSTNDGNSWSEGIRVNQDQLNNGKIQYFPFLAIDDKGGLNVLFYDDRNTTSDSADVFLARSTDGGDSWNEFEISGTRFKPKAIAGGSSNYQGDHISLLPIGNKLHAFWMADYTGIYQVWSSIIDLNLTPVKENEPNVVENFKLYQNYPNPFNPITKIRYTMPTCPSCPLLSKEKDVRVRLKVNDVLGNEVATLVDDYKPTGSYEVEFDASKLPSGIYFYRLQTSNGFTSTKKLVLLK